MILMKLHEHPCFQLLQFTGIHSVQNARITHPSNGQIYPLNRVDKTVSSLEHGK